MRPQIDQSLYELYLSGQKVLQELGSEACGIVMAAVKVPAYKISFYHEGAMRHMLIPPTYANMENALLKIDSMVEGAFGKAEPIRAPFKVLAVAMGLAEYGRNNLAYVKGFGSYSRLRCYLVREDPGSSDPRQLIFLSRGFDEDFLAEPCISCRICTADCPTGALLEDSFPVDSARCLTYANELPGPFPDWVDKDVHNCLVGCMGCQRSCPMNEGLLEVHNLEEGFGEAEAGWLADPENRYAASLPEHIRRILRMNGLEYLEDVLARNFQALLSSTAINT